MGQIFLIVIDAYSKWTEIEIVKSATAQNTIKHLRMMFARFGLPKVLVSDNGTCFTSGDFSEFTLRNGIKHLRIAPYHLSSNGQAERAVQTFKLGMKKQSDGTLQSKLSHFLFYYRLTPHATTRVTPAELLLNRRPRSHLDLVVPSLSDQVQQQQQKQKAQHDRGCTNRSFQQGDSVLARNIRQGSSNDLPWLLGMIVRPVGPLSYEIKLSNDQIIRRHIDHIRPNEMNSADTPTTMSVDILDDVLPFTTSQPPTPVNAGCRRSQREQCPPERFQA